MIVQQLKDKAKKEYAEQKYHSAADRHTLAHGNLMAAKAYEDAAAMITSAVHHQYSAAELITKYKAEVKKLRNGKVTDSVSYHEWRESIKKNMAYIAEVLYEQGL